MNELIKQGLGQAVTAHREASGLGKAKFALVAGVSRITLRRIEAGDDNPTLDVLLRIADGFDMPVEDLLAEGRRLAEASKV